MDAREKIANIIALVRDGEGDSPNVTADAILALPELEAYIEEKITPRLREKFENEPGRLVAEKECPHCDGGKMRYADGPGSMNCPFCSWTGTIKRRMTRKEVEELAVTIVNQTKAVESNPWLTSKGERVSVEES